MVSATEMLGYRQDEGPSVVRLQVACGRWRAHAEPSSQPDCVHLPQLWAPVLPDETTLVDGLLINIITVMQNSMEVPQKTKNRTTI